MAGSSRTGTPTHGTPRRFCAASLALAPKPDGSGPLEPLAAFNTNPAGSAVVNAVGPIRQIVQSAEKEQRRYLVIVPGTVGKLGAPVQVQAD